MLKKIQISLTILLTTILVSCQYEPVEVEFIGIEDNIANFIVKGSADQDIYSLNFVVTYYSPTDEVLKTDTVEYTATAGTEGNIIPFLEAEGQTYFSQKAPANAKSASATAIKVNYEKPSDDTNL